jgi:hypothetical protein
MRRLLCILGFFAVCAGCNVKGADFPNHRLVPTPTPSPTPGQSLANLSSFCQDAPTLTLPGTYPAFELNGVLTGTTFAPVSTDELFEYADFVAEPEPVGVAVRRLERDGNVHRDGAQFDDLLLGGLVRQPG